MAAAENVSFDILLGGKVTPEALKAIRDMEEHLKKFGATTRTINAVMSRTYKEMFDGISEHAKKSAEHAEHSFKEAFKHMVEQSKEASEKIKKSFERLHESGEKLFELFKKPLEMVGFGGVLSSFGIALGGEEVVKRSLEIYGARQAGAATLRAALASRGREDLVPGYEEAIAKVTKGTPVGREFAEQALTKMAASGRYRNPEEAQRMLTALIGLGGGTQAGAEASLAAFSRMMAGGRLTTRGIASIAGGSGAPLLRQLLKDTGAKDVLELQKMFGAKGQGPAAGLAALKKAVLELGDTVGKGEIEAHMHGWAALITRVGKVWDDISAKIGEAWDGIVSPLLEDFTKWLESTDWEQSFKPLIDSAKAWGNTIRVIGEQVAASPVVKTIENTFARIWNALTGGVKMYEEKPTRVWKTLAEAMEHPSQEYIRAHTKLVYRMTPEGEKFVTQTTETITKALKGVWDFLKFVADNWLTITLVFVGLLGFFTAIKAIEMTVWAVKTVKSLNDVLSAFTGLVAKMLAVARGEAVTEAVVTATEAGTAGSIAAGAATVGTLAGLPIALAELHRRYGVLGKTGAEPKEVSPGIPGLGTEGRAPAGSIFKSSRQIAAEAQAARQQEKNTDLLKKHSDAVDDNTKALTGPHSPGLTPAVDAATTAFNNLLPIIANASTAFAQIGAMGGGFGGGFSGGLAGESGANKTEYGPAVPGDQPGGPTYDWNSYHHIGAFGHLGNLAGVQDVAMHDAHAWAKYHVRPGGFYYDDAGRLCRFQDHSGSSNPNNEDYFKGAFGGVITGPTRALLGERGPEMVLPLTGNLLSKVGHTVNLSFGNISFGAGASEPGGEAFIREFAETIANEVKRVIEAENRRSAVV